MREETEGLLNLGNGCYHSFGPESFVFPFAISHMKVKIYKLQFCLFVCWYKTEVHKS